MYVAETFAFTGDFVWSAGKNDKFILYCFNLPMFNY